MEELISSLTSWNWLALLSAGAWVAAGIVLGRLARRGIERVLTEQVDAHFRLLLGRVAAYGILALFLVAALRELGFELGLLLGAAGILTVAVGFASQTSASNLVSGLFLIAEHPFALGDVIRIGSTLGEVLSIDLLSVKLRTFDNLYVRIPNELVIKSEVTNLTRFPIRRLELAVGIAYKEDLGEVEQLLMSLADDNPLCLDEPKPFVLVQGFGDSAINLQLFVWAQSANLLGLRNSLQVDIKRAFDAAGIEIPFPHRSLYAGSRTDPLPVRLVPDASHP